MSLHATFIEHTFVSILALYVTLECAVTILQTRAAEKSCGRVPEGFEKKLTLAGIRKAADYTGELAQANLLLTVVGAGFALFMTFGNGLNVFTAVIETIMGPGIPADWVLISLIVLLMLLIELPFGWWARYRVKERYGYMREPRMRWLSRTLSEALWGWLVFMPVSAALLTIFEYAGGDWWKLAWGVWLVYLLWRWKLSSVYGVFWKRRSRPYANAETREAVRESLHRQGITMTEMVVMTRPASWDHSNIVLSGWGLRRRVIVFAHVAHLLRKDEICLLYTSCSTAMDQALRYANEGYKWVVDLDLAKFFDTVNHSKLLQVLSERVKDRRVIRLIPVSYTHLGCTPVEPKPSLR